MFCHPVFAFRHYAVCTNPWAIAKAEGKRWEHHFCVFALGNCYVLGTSFIVHFSDFGFNLLFRKGAAKAASKNCHCRACDRIKHFFSSPIYYRLIPSKSWRGNIFLLSLSGFCLSGQSSGKLVSHIEGPCDSRWYGDASCIRFTCRCNLGNA